MGEERQPLGRKGQRCQKSGTGERGGQGDATELPPVCMAGQGSKVQPAARGSGEWGGILDNMDATQRKASNGHSPDRTERKSAEYK